MRSRTSAAARESLWQVRSGRRLCVPHLRQRQSFSRTLLSQKTPSRILRPVLIQVLVCYKRLRNPFTTLDDCFCSPSQPGQTQRVLQLLHQLVLLYGTPSLPPLFKVQWSRQGHFHLGMAPSCMMPARTSLALLTSQWLAHRALCSLHAMESCCFQTAA
jgi:hypothetical protein